MPTEGGDVGNQGFLVLQRRLGAARKTVRTHVMVLRVGRRDLSYRSARECCETKANYIKNVRVANLPTLGLRVLVILVSRKFSMTVTFLLDIISITQRVYRSGMLSVCYEVPVVH